MPRKIDGGAMATENDIEGLAMVREPDSEAVRPRVFTTGDLRKLGWGKRRVRAAVVSGQLVPVRRGSYLLPGEASETVEAARARGRVACISLLKSLGVFVLENSSTHLHFDRDVRKAAPVVRTQVWHWVPLCRTPHPRATSVHIIDALAQATSCQEPRAAIATLESALHLGLVEFDDLDEIFANVPRRRRVLRKLVRRGAESGPETLMRLIALSLGFDVRIQVAVRGVGRVDLILDGWLVVECDSREFHSGWDSQKKDRRRDLALAALGFTTLRPVAEDIMGHPEVIVEALRGLREARDAACRPAPRP